MLEGHYFFSLMVKVTQSISVRELTVLTVLTVPTVLTVLGLDSSCCIAKLLTVGSRVLRPDISILYTLTSYASHTTSLTDLYQIVICYTDTLSVQCTLLWVEKNCRLNVLCRPVTHQEGKRFRFVRDL